MAKLITGDCIEEMAKLPENSIDAIVTDPPYGLKFMGKEFDDLGEGAQQREWHRLWAVEALRVLKPGGHLIAFGGTRTYHHLATAVEEAGFEIRDQIQWLYGSGFPKSLNVGKAIDKKRDDRKEIEIVVRWLENTRKQSGVSRQAVERRFGTKNIGQSFFTITPGSTPRVPSIDQCQVLFDLFGVKPEDVPEDIARLLIDLNGKKGQPGENWFKREVVGKKTAGMGSGKTFGMLQSEGNNSEAKKELDITAPATEEAARWEGWGTALKPANEPCVLARKPFKGTVAENVQEWGTGAMNIEEARIGGKEGRWPANVILDEEAGELLDEQSGIEEGPARFFYCPKAAKKERNAGLEEFEEKKSGVGALRDGGRGKTATNHHPTVKPVKLMAYLIRLVTPPGGTVLDPFLGSGSTGCAAVEEGFDFIGIEREQEYMEIAAARIAYWEKEQAAEQEKQADSDEQAA